METISDEKFEIIKGVLNLSGKNLNKLVLDSKDLLDVKLLDVSHNQLKFIHGLSKISSCKEVFFKHLLFSFLREKGDDEIRNIAEWGNKNKRKEQQKRFAKTILFVKWKCGGEPQSQCCLITAEEN